MIIDTESEEGKAPVTLAKIGHWCLNEIERMGYVYDYDSDAQAEYLGIITADGDKTALAKLPEGI